MAPGNSTGNRGTNRFSALQSLVAENDTEVEDELARGELCRIVLIASSVPVSVERVLGAGRMDDAVQSDGGGHGPWVKESLSGYLMDVSPECKGQHETVLLGKLQGDGRGSERIRSS